MLTSEICSIYTMNAAVALMFCLIATYFVDVSPASKCSRPLFGLPPRHPRANLTLWRQVRYEDAEHVASIEVSVPQGAAVYHALQVAALASGAFRFEATLQDGVHFITSIGGLQETPRQSVYWVLYKVPTPPNTANPFPGTDNIATKGVDGTLVKDGDNFLLYLQRVYVK